MTYNLNNLKIPKGFRLIKEYQIWGICPTIRNNDKECFYLHYFQSLGQHFYQWVNWDLKRQILKREWEIIYLNEYEKLKFYREQIERDVDNLCIGHFLHFRLK